MIVIGLDIGTTSVCGVALELPAGRLLRSVTLPNRSAIAPGGGAEEGQRPGDIMRAVEAIASQLTALYPQAACIGVTGQMHGVVYVDASGEAVSPLYTWQDRRGLQPVAGGETFAGRLARLTGYPLATGYGLVTHAALSGAGETPAQASRLCTIGDYAAMRLANGNVPVMDASNAASIGLFDARRGRFDEAALAAAGIRAELLPQVVATATRVGETAAGVPVFQAIGDNQASVLGSVRKLRESLLLNVGTGGQISVYSPRYRAVDGLETRPFPGGGCLLVGASLAGGKSYAMLERFFRQVMEAFGAAGGDAPDLYGAMEALLDRMPPVRDPLTVRTQFFGTRDRPELRGAIEGIGPGNWTPAHLTAGFLEGMAEELHAYYARLPLDMRDSLRSLVGAGNGIRRNRHLRRICAARFGLPLAMPSVREEASVGAALHAAVGLGAADGYEAACRLLPPVADEAAAGGPSDQN